ncbi:Oligopeptide-binding protein OppA [Baekduia alba]|uniref:ABC transporter substrate-binding protein n=1 Tax=Baekduia alba TaxID=2997333 RepID=UPI00233FA67A|nr:ABC transporter substrate-binding protein [Baekduia alba]WCB93329.1 Oligopeptide-binding protein OppA [Baekduia alba]
MQGRIRIGREALLAGAVAAGLAVAGCGGGGDSGGGSGSTSGAANAGASVNAKAAQAPGRRGGTLIQLGASDVDYLDPGHTYYTQGLQVIYATNRPLYSYKPDDAAHPVPDMAAAAPKISPDAKTVTVRLRTGVRYAPPVDRAVTSADVKYALERFFSVNVGGQYPGYFQVIQGAPAKPTTGVKPIAGIATPDAHTIVFHLTKPTGVAFAAALSMPATVPVPEDYAKRFDDKNPSTYNTHVAFTGPYMVKNDASGNLVGYRPGKAIELVRNPNWNAKTDFRPAYVDAIRMKTDFTDANVAARQVLDGKDMVLDTNPPAAVLKDLVQHVKDQYVTMPAGGYRYFPLNTEIKPFDDLNVRKAVLAGFDRTAALKARGGKYTGEVATHLLPPGFPGFDQAGGAKGFDDLDFFNDKNESGDMATAAKYFKLAGYPSGKYTGNARLLMVGANADPGKGQAEVAAGQLEKMGFDVKLRLVPQDAVYTNWCQVPSKKVAMCGGTAWFRDFADPEAMIEPLFKGALIDRSSGNANYSMLNDPKVDAAMDKAALATGDDRLRQWAGVDRLVMQDAAAIPFDWDRTTLVRSKDVNGVANEFMTMWDYAYTSLKD